MDSKIQAIIRIDGEIVYYLYDKDIENFINTWTKFRLEADGRKIDKVETELNTPPLKWNEVRR
jgi:hypothetical protein